MAHEVKWIAEDEERWQRFLKKDNPSTIKMLCDLGMIPFVIMWWLLCRVWLPLVGVVIVVFVVVGLLWAAFKLTAILEPMYGPLIKWLLM